jgi:putative nucleotidyltransferase with HDIG domain
MERIPLSGEKSTVFASLRAANLLITTWMAALWVAATVMALALVSHGFHLATWWMLVGLAAVGALAERLSIPITRTTEASVAFLPFVFTAVALGPLSAMVVGAAGALVGDFRSPYLRTFVYAPIRGLSLGVAGAAATAIQPHTTAGFASILVASLVAAVANQTSDLIFNMATLTIRRSGSALGLMSSVGPYLVLSLSLYVPVVGLLVYGYQQYSIWIVGTFLIPALACQRVTQLYQGQRQSAQALAAANVRLERANLSFATALVATLDARDRYTAGHSAAVAIYSRDIASRLGLDDDAQRLAHVCGLVHDIGKVGLPPGLLEKPGALTLEERRQMEEHSEIGERILSKVDNYTEIARIVRHHHERFDGLGYPDGLRGDEIPLLSRIIAVADAYNAMTSDRPYRDAMPSRVARLRLAQAVESQFDTGVVAAFEAILAGASDEYRVGAATSFSFDRQWTHSRHLREVSRADKRRFGSRVDAELLENISDVGLHGDLADEQALGYLSVREALSQ